MEGGAVDGRVRIMAEPLELCVKGASDNVVAYACGACRIVAPNRTAALECCAPRLCTKCGVETGKRYVTICDTCRRSEWADKERIRVEKLLEAATRIRPADYDHDYVCRDASGDEYLTVDDAIDEGLAWAWAVAPMAWPELDAADIVSSAFEDEYPEDADESVDSDALQAVLDAWRASLGPCPFFMVDTTRVVELPDPVESKEAAG